MQISIEMIHDGAEVDRARSHFLALVLFPADALGGGRGRRDVGVGGQGQHQAVAGAPLAFAGGVAPADDAPAAQAAVARDQRQDVPQRPARVAGHRRRVGHAQPLLLTGFLHPTNNNNNNNIKRMASDGAVLPIGSRSLVL